MREVHIPEEMMSWHYTQQRAVGERQAEYASAGTSRPTSAVAASSSGIPTVSFDEAIAAMPYRTEEHRTFRGRTFNATKKASQPEVASSSSALCSPAQRWPSES